MRRNPALMMYLLEACADGKALSEDEKGLIPFEEEKFSQETIRYHLRQLEEAGYTKTDLDGKKDPVGHLRAKKAIELAQYHVTPKGHDRLALSTTGPFEVWV